VAALASVYSIACVRFSQESGPDDPLDSSSDSEADDWRALKTGMATVCGDDCQNRRRSEVV